METLETPLDPPLLWRQRRSVSEGTGPWQWSCNYLSFPPSVSQWQLGPLDREQGQVRVWLGVCVCMESFPLVCVCMRWCPQIPLCLQGVSSDVCPYVQAVGVVHSSAWLGTCSMPAQILVRGRGLNVRRSVVSCPG